MSEGLEDLREGRTDGKPPHKVIRLNTETGQEGLGVNGGPQGAL